MPRAPSREALSTGSSRALNASEVGALKAESDRLLRLGVHDDFFRALCTDAELLAPLRARELQEPSVHRRVAAPAPAYAQRARPRLAQVGRRVKRAVPFASKRR